MSAQNNLQIVAVFVLSYVLFLIFQWKDLRRRLPPGPTPLPFIGNKHQIPSIKPWLTFAQWNKRYGPVISLWLGSTPVIVLGTANAAWDLLEKRSDIYSSRPRFVVAGEILSANMRGLMLPYGEPWRRWRKILHTGFNSRKSETYKDIQSFESKLLLFQILTEPKEYERHLQRYAASVATSVAYGRRIDSVDEWIVKENMAAMDYLTSVNIPGKYLVESWPWLLKLPRSWQWFRREPEQYRQRDIKFLMHIFEDVKRRMSNGTCPDCLASQTIANIHQTDMSELEVAYALSTPFGAGIETTAGTLLSFILAMLHFPEVMKKAQDELDAVVGRDRLPDFADSPDLPYIDAVIKETLRWRPIAVLGGTPHATIADDEYNGMFIPRGSTVFANLFGIMHDPDMFPEPDLFNPQRFIETTDPRLQSFELPFGFGRRVCVGKTLAWNSLFINIARILWAFDVRPTINENGHPILPDWWDFTNGFNSRPVSFRCQFVPRSESTIRAVWEDAREKMNI